MNRQKVGIINNECMIFKTFYFKKKRIIYDMIFSLCFNYTLYRFAHQEGHHNKKRL